MSKSEVEKRSLMIINAIYKMLDHETQKKYYRYKVKIDEKYLLYRTSVEWVICDIKTRERHAIKANGRNEIGRIIQLYFAQYNV